MGLGEGVEAPLEANDGDGEVPEAGEIARQVAGSHPAAVFVVGDVAHVVESIFDAPMPAHQGHDDLRGGLVGGHGGQAVYGLVLDLAGLDDAPLALDAKANLTMRQGGAVKVLGEVEHPAASLLDSSVSLVRGVMLGGAHLGKLPIDPSQLGEQVGAIVLDRGHHVVRAALLDQAPGGVVVGVHRVEGHDAAGEVEPGDQGTHGRDLVALVIDRLLSEDDSRAVLRSGDEQVLGARIVPGGTADVLPVDGDGVGARGLLRGPGARRAVERIGVQVGENLDERGRGRGGEAPQTGAVERPQGTKLMLGQRLGELADCGRTVGARTDRILWENGGGALSRFPTAHNYPGKVMNGKRVLGKPGLRVTQMGMLPVTVYTGEVFGKNGATVIPDHPEHLPAIWCFCASHQYYEAVRTIDQSLKVTIATMAKVPFDLDRWTKVAEERYPHGLPRPYSDDPTQWIFHGHPCGSVLWDETEKWTVRGPLRTDPSVLHIAMARLLGYRWPAEQDADMELADEQREWVRRSEELLGWADEDGIVCIPSVRGEPPAGERILGLLAAAYGDAWNEGILTKLLAEAGSQSLDDWLRNHYFEQHCKLFHHRPFVWHIWDGRRRDGFHALVSYHKLAEGDGKGRRLLASLTYSYLGDWIACQKDGVQRDEVGAADRLAAAEALQERLAAIIEGEPPLDIFVRWKPVHEQPIGWEPDINDGVRLNIRPFMAEDIPGGKKGAGILRAKPNIHWRKDRGNEPLTRGRRSKPPWLEDEDWDPEDERELRPQQDYPWFWNGDAFTGDRMNDLHLSIGAKSAYRLATERTRR